MTNLRNSVQLIGRLGMNPEVKTFGDNKKVVRITLATDDSYKNSKGEKVEETQWHNLVLWNNQASIAEKYLTKGKEICIEGKLVSRSYEAKDGVRKYVTEIVVNELIMLGTKA